MRVKLCGITNHEDAQKAVYYGAWAVGFIFYKKSPRYASPSKVKKIIEELPPFITPVGVFVNQNEKAVKDICRFTRIRTVQFHGDETAVYCKRFKDYKIIKAFRVGSFLEQKMIEKFKVDAYLFDAYQPDAYGGTGKTFNWDLINKTTFNRPVILSGGLKESNIQAAIAAVRPYAVDVSSSLEKTPGIKDPRKIRAFFNTINTL
jgi:phosphoribosylanthranilate isomerase